MQRLPAAGVCSATNAFAVSDDARTAYLHDPKADVVFAIDISIERTSERRALKWDDKNFAHRRWVCYSLFSWTSTHQDFLSILFFNQHKKVFCLVHFLVSGDLLVKVQTNALNTSCINKERLAYSISKENNENMQVIFYERFHSSSSSPELIQSRHHFVYCCFSSVTMRVSTRNGVLPPGQWELPWISSHSLHFLSTSSRPHLFLSYSLAEGVSWEGAPPHPAGILAISDAYPPRKAVWCNAWRGGIGWFSVTEKTETPSGLIERRTDLWKVDVDSDLKWKKHSASLESPEHTKFLTFRLVPGESSSNSSLVAIVHADCQYGEAALFRVFLESSELSRRSSSRIVSECGIEGRDEETSSEGHSDENIQLQQQSAPGKKTGAKLRRSGHSGRYRRSETAGAQSTVREPHLLADLTCPVCLDTYEDARTLACGHSMCWECVEQMRISVKSETIRCPSCRQPTTVPSGGLPVNYGLKDALSALSRVVQTRRGLGRCVGCEDKTETAKMWLCITCCRREQSAFEKPFPHTRVSSLSQLRSTTSSRVLRRPASLLIPSITSSQSSEGGKLEAKPPVADSPSASTRVLPIGPRCVSSKALTLCDASYSASSPSTQCPTAAVGAPLMTSTSAPSIRMKSSRLEAHFYCAVCLLNNHAGHEYDSVEAVKQRRDLLDSKRQKYTVQANAIVEQIRKNTINVTEQVVLRTLSGHLSQKFLEIFDVLSLNSPMYPTAATSADVDVGSEGASHKSDVDRRAELLIARFVNIAAEYEQRIGILLTDLLEVCKRESIKKDHLSTPSSHFFDYLNTNVDQTGKEPGTAEVTACQADSSTGPSPEKATEL